MRVTLISMYDYAESGQRILEALDRHSDFICSYVCLHQRTPEFPPKRHLKVLTDLEKYNIANADILIFKGDELPIEDPTLKLWAKPGCMKSDLLKIKRRKRSKGVIVDIGVVPKSGCKKVLLAGGGGFRRDEGPGSIDSFEWFEFSDYKVDMFLAISPELAYPEVNGKYLGFTIDSERIQPTWNWGLGDTLVVGCYPTGTREKTDRKGVDRNLIPAVNRLIAEGYKVCVQEIGFVSYEESLRIKSECHVLFENITSYGCYGNSGIEAMQYGVPIMCHISKESLERSGMINHAEPVLKVSDPETVYLTLKSILDGIIDMKTLSKQTKEYCDKYHSYRGIGEKLKGFINQLN